MANNSNLVEMSFSKIPWLPWLLICKIANDSINSDQYLGAGHYLQWFSLKRDTFQSSLTTKFGQVHLNSLGHKLGHIRSQIYHQSKLSLKLDPCLTQLSRFQSRMFIFGTIGLVHLKGIMSYLIHKILFFFQINNHKLLKCMSKLFAFE